MALLLAFASAALSSSSVITNTLAFQPVGFYQGIHSRSTNLAAYRNYYRNHDGFGTSSQLGMSFSYNVEGDDDDDEIEEEFDVEKFMEERRLRKAAEEAAGNSGKEEDLADEFYKNLRVRNIGRNTRLDRLRRKPQLFSSDVRNSEDEDDEDNENAEVNDDEPVREFTASEMNIFKGYDDFGVGKLAGNVTITNKDLYNTLKERVLESPSSFQKLTKGADDEIATDDTYTDKSYTPPTTIPDSELTAGEVVTTVLEALRNNDVPTKNKGVEVLFAYSSSASILADPSRAPSVDEYADGLKTSSDSRILLDHRDVVFDKADYSQDHKRAFINVRLKDAEGTFTGVNFMLSMRSSDQCWLIDSHLVKARGLRRGKRW